MEEAYYQYSRGYSVQMCPTINKEEAHHQYDGGCAVW